MSKRACNHSRVCITRNATHLHTIRVRDGKLAQHRTAFDADPDWSWDTNLACEECGEERFTDGFAGPGIGDLPEWCQRAYAAAFPDTAAQSAASLPPISLPE